MAGKKGIHLAVPLAVTDASEFNPNVDIQLLSFLKNLAETQATAGLTHVQIEVLSNKLTRDGKPFWEVQLLDATSRISLRVWNDHPEYARFTEIRAGDFFELKGEFYKNGTFGIDVRKFSLRPLSLEERDALLAGPPEIRDKQAADFAGIIRLIETLQDPRLLALCRLFIEELGTRFSRTAGARFVHHARRGGLVEHTAQMMRTAQAVADVYPYLNRDLLLAGTLLHDIGKLWENHVAEDAFAISLDERGELLGHITIGTELVNSLWRKLQPALESWTALEPASEQVRLHLLHLVASHHGSLEFGSPVVPKTPEAVALNMIDNLDAKLEIFAQGYRSLPLLAPRIRDKVRPLNHLLVDPLPVFQAAAEVRPLVSPVA